MFYCNSCCSDEQSDLQGAAQPVAIAYGAAGLDCEPLDQGPSKEQELDRDPLLGETQASADAALRSRAPSEPLPEPLAEELSAEAPPSDAESPEQIARQAYAGTGKNFFEVTLNLNKGEDPGMSLEMSEGPFLRVSKVERRGPIPTYNAIAPEDEQIRDGHFIVAISGERRVRNDGKEMMAVLLKGGLVRLSFRRAQYFTVGPLRKSGSTLGIDLSYQARSTSVAVKQVFPTGVLVTWNQTAAHHLQVRQNDHILAVNGEGGSAQTLVQAMTESEVIELLLTRPVEEV